MKGLLAKVGQRIARSCLSETTPDQAAATDHRVRSWRGGDIVVIRVSGEYFTGDLVTNLSKDPPSVVSFQM